MTESPVPTALAPAALQPFPAGELRPAGWLRAQLQAQADGMAGHLDEIWPDIADSAWIGGAAEGWERAPYWLDALVPLAAALDDARLQQKVHDWIGRILDRQEPDGWMGPHEQDPPGAGSARRGPYDVWPRMVLLKALLQFHDATGDARVVPAALALCRRIEEVLRQWPLFEWGRARWADLVLCLDRLRALSGEPGLGELADLVRAQGFDWAGYGRAFPFAGKVDEAQLQRFRADSGLSMSDAYLSSHGVNVAMGLKAMPVWSRHADPAGQRAAFDALLSALDEHHGQATGAFTCDEHLAGTHPGQGTETCAVVEYLFSLETALQAWGADEAIAARWERLAFNALPAPVRPDEWGHQYDQQANQVLCHVTEDRIYTNNGPDANTFGFAPHFGCCTANRHQGWPKFAAHLWMRDEEGLTALSYAPCRLDTTVGAANVQVAVEGDYPFAERVEIRVRADRPGRFPIRLRIPGWAEGASVALDGAAAEPVPAGAVHAVRADWAGEHTVTLVLPVRTGTMARPGGAVSVTRGPLVFALAVAEDWRRIGGEDPAPQWEVHPAGPWNLSLRLDPDRPELRVESRPVSGPVFSTGGAPVVLHGRARVVPEWTLQHGAADAPPPSPCPGTGEEQDVVLLPYGAARLRVTDLPWYRPG